MRVDLKDVMEGPGSYGPSQLEVIFGRIFDENRTRQFSFRDEDVTVTGPGVAFARGRWLRKASGGGSETTDTVTFTLRQESGDWRDPRDPLVALSGVARGRVRRLLRRPLGPRRRPPPGRGGAGGGRRPLARAVSPGS